MVGLPESKTNGKKEKRKVGEPFIIWDSLFRNPQTLNLKMRGNKMFDHYGHKYECEFRIFTADDDRESYNSTRVDLYCTYTIVFIYEAIE